MFESCSRAYKYQIYEHVNPAHLILPNSISLTILSEKHDWLGSLYAIHSSHVCYFVFTNSTSLQNNRSNYSFRHFNFYFHAKFLLLYTTKFVSIVHFVYFFFFEFHDMEFNVRLFLQFLTEISVHIHTKCTTLPFCIAVFLCQKCRQILQNRLWMQGYKLLPANLKMGMVLSWVSCFSHLFNTNLQEEIKWDHIASDLVI